MNQYIFIRIIVIPYQNPLLEASEPLHQMASFPEVREKLDTIDTSQGGYRSTLTKTTTQYLSIKFLVLTVIVLRKASDTKPFFNKQPKT